MFTLALLVQKYYSDVHSSNSTYRVFHKITLLFQVEQMKQMYLSIYLFSCQKAVRSRVKKCDRCLVLKSGLAWLIGEIAAVA